MENCMHKIEGGTEESFAWEILKEQIKSSKRWFMSFIIVLSMLFATNIAWLLYINKYDFF